VLVELSRRLKANTREVDLVARYGGEEFVLLLPRTEADGAMALAEKLREAVCETPFQTEAGPLPVTVSVGVAAYPECAESLAAMVAAADEALYRAKAAGKNRVHRAPHAGG
jgi:diguanylate cyclase (GGDEF)-like protein